MPNKCQDCDQPTYSESTFRCTACAEFMLSLMMGADPDESRPPMPGCAGGCARRDWRVLHVRSCPNADPDCAPAIVKNDIIPCLSCGRPTYSGQCPDCRVKENYLG